ncbi:MAG: hypothetical protein HY072_05455 [Deltaproteobacteria bacterium]|nr:hypothetical protein [Deltaproteobacteria bacterium]
MRYKKILIFFFISILTISFLLSHNCSKITNNTKTDSKLLKTDLIECILALSHSDSKYVVPDSTRQTGFLALLNSILDAIEKILLAQTIKIGAVLSKIHYQDMALNAYLIQKVSTGLFTLGI